VGRVTIAGAAWGLREELAGLGEERGPLLGFLLDRAELGLDRFTEERRQRQALGLGGLEHALMEARIEAGMQVGRCQLHLRFAGAICRTDCYEQ
jgi:hypothetical protein